jgi:hypothetical protein
MICERDDRLCLIAGRQVAADVPSRHDAGRVDIRRYTDPANFADSSRVSSPLYRAGNGIWRQGTDRAGASDFAAVEVERCALPAMTRHRAVMASQNSRRAAVIRRRIGRFATVRCHC